MKYLPINLKNHNFADLILVITGKITNEDIAKIMEKEVSNWLKDFPVPLRCVASDDKDDSIDLKEFKKATGVIGYIEYGEEVIKWTDDIPNFAVKDDELEEVYRGVNFENRDQLIDKANSYVKEKVTIKRFVNFSIIGWTIAAILIAYLGWQSSFIGIIAFIFSLYKIIKGFLRLKVFKTKREK